MGGLVINIFNRTLTSLCLLFLLFISLKIDIILNLLLLLIFYQLFLEFFFILKKIFNNDNKKKKIIFISINNFNVIIIIGYINLVYFK